MALFTPAQHLIHRDTSGESRAWRDLATGAIYADPGPCTNGCVQLAGKEAAEALATLTADDPAAAVPVAWAPQHHRGAGGAQGPAACREQDAQAGARQVVTLTPFL